jgi:membrane associated rhomboid family serine protease
MVFIPLYDDNPFRHLPRPYVNYVLIAATIVGFFATGGLDEAAVQAAAMQFGFIPSAASGVEVLGPEYQRLPEAATYVTYAFLHANWVHLLGNLAFLWVFGDNVEDALGHLRYFVFYVACAAAAAFIHAHADAASPLPLVGASGAVAGVVGAYLVLYPRRKVWILALGRIPLHLSAAIVIGAWAAFQVVNAALASPDESVAWSVHLGGLTVGALLVVLMRRRGVPLFGRRTPETG